MSLENTDVVLRVRHEDLRPSKTNPRKDYPAAELQELADNITYMAERALQTGSQELGVQTPLFVRPADSAGRHEIISGERRWRATELALRAANGELRERLEWLPVMVRDWSTDAVMEFQLIENLRRADLTPMEEAEGYRALQARGLSVPEIAARVGTNTSDIYRAMKWVKLPPLAREAFAKGVIGKEVASMLARIPGERERRKAALEVVAYGHGVSGELEELEAAAQRREPQPMTKLQVAEHLRDFYMAQLDGVGFDLADAELLPAELDEAGERVRGGACVGCPHRVQDNPLFADLVVSGAGARGSKIGNVCTRPECRQSKLAVQFTRDAAEAETQGLKVMPQSEAQKVFTPEGVIRYGSDYVDIEAKPSLDLIGHANTAKIQTWGKMLQGAEVPVVVAQAPDGTTRRLVQRDVAVTAVQVMAAEKGKECPLVAKSSTAADAAARKEQERKLAEEKAREKLAFSYALGALAQAGGGMGLEGWQMLARMILLRSNMDALRALCAGLGLEPQTPQEGDNVSSSHYAAAVIERYVDTGTVDTLPTLVVAAVCAGDAWLLLKSKPLEEAMRHYSVSLLEAKQRAKDELSGKAQKKAAKKAKRELQDDGMQSGKTLSGADVTVDGELVVPVVDVDDGQEEAPAVKPKKGRAKKR